MRLPFHRYVFPGVLGLMLSLSVPAVAEVSWMEILEDPDNVELNETFARERLAKGDLSAALSAVERVISETPASSDLRLLRAEILFQLANDSLASGELQALAQLPLSPGQMRRVNELIVLIEQRKQRVIFDGRLTVGLLGTDNANIFPETGKIDYKSDVLDYTSAGDAKSKIQDVAGIANVGMGMTYDLGTQDGDVVYANLSATKMKGNRYEFLTSDSVSVSTGARVKLGSVTVQPSLGFTDAKRKTSANQIIRSAGLTLLYNLTPKIRMYSSADHNIIDAKKSVKFTNANQGDGASTRYRIGSFFAGNEFAPFLEASAGSFNPKESQFSSTLQPSDYLNSRAKRNTFAGSQIGLRYRVANWASLQSSFDYKRTKYSDQDPTSLKYRRDKLRQLRLVLQMNGADLLPILDGWSVLWTYTKIRNHSNIKQYDFSKNDIGLNLSHKFM